jgi:probable HAF family extracellular repeat protein
LLVPPLVTQLVTQPVDDLAPAGKRFGGARMYRSRSLAAFAATSLLVLLATPEGRRAATPPGPYVVTDLGTLGGLSAQAYDLNELGHVVGYATNNASQGRAFLWRNGLMEDLGTLGGLHADAQDINDLGQVVGRSRLDSSSTVHAVLWENGTKVDLTPGIAHASANAINNHRQIVGTKNYAIAFKWENGVITDLPHLGGGGGTANDINDAGQAVGSSSATTDLGPMGHAVLWQNGTATDLGVLPGEQDSGASAINNLGQIVGTSGSMDPDTYEVTSRAFLYENGAMTALPVPSWEAYASDINDNGVIVGTMRAAGGFSKYHGWIYADGVVTNLNSLIPTGMGLHIAYAYGINSAGQIAGVAYDAQYRYHAVLLTPAEPGTPVANLGDVSVTEGHSGTRAASFTVTLSTAASQPVTLSYQTADGTATAGSDYQSASGSVTLATGQTSKSFTVLVNGDRTGEPNENFIVNLSNASGAVIGDAQGVATIVDDEPRASISDVSKNEGHSGTSSFNFIVSLSAASTATVNIPYATANGSASSSEDYDAKSGVLSFAPGQTSKTITVSVRGDRKREGHEVFNVNVSPDSGAYFVYRVATGVIRNDD